MVLNEDSKIMFLGELFLIESLSQRFLKAMQTTYLEVLALCN